MRSSASLVLEAEAAAPEGRLRKIKGLGASVERKSLKGAALRPGAEGPMLANRAEELLEHAARRPLEIIGVSIALGFALAAIAVMLVLRFGHVTG